MIKVLRIQLYRIIDRRRYRETVSRKIRTRASVLRRIEFPLVPIYKGNLLIIPSNVPNLMKCEKSGSWIKNRIRLGRSHIWVSKSRKYFVDIKHSISIIAGDTSLLRSASLELLANCRITDDHKSGKSLNIYSSLVNYTDDPSDLEMAIFLDVSGAGSFQHFVQDCLPIISLIQDLPEIPQGIPIILREPDMHFLSFRSYLDAIKCTNPIYFIKRQFSIVVEKLYFVRFLPFNANYSLPPSLYESMYSKLSLSKLTLLNRQRSVILVNRQERIRNFKEFKSIANRLGDWCARNSLELQVLNTKEMEFHELQRAFSCAKFVFAVHGGANYNMIWAPSDATLIEFIPTQSTDSLIHLTLSCGQNYVPYALQHDKGDMYFNVSTEDIDTITDYLDSAHQNLDT